MLRRKFTPYADQMHDWKNAGSLVVVLGRRNRVWKQPSDMRMASKPRWHARSDKSVDLPCLEHVRERSSFRRIFEVDILRQRDGDLFWSAGLFKAAPDPVDVRGFDAVVIFENCTCPHIGRQLIFRHTDLLALQIGWRLDAIGPDINRRVAKSARHEGRHAHIGTIALVGLEGETRHRQFTDIEFRPTKSAEKNLLRIERHEYRIDTVDPDKPIRQGTGAVIVADSYGNIKFGHTKPADRQNCRDVIGEMMPGCYSTPRFCVFSSGVTSIARACPVIFTDPPQFFMQGFRFQNTFSVISRSSS